MAMSFVDPVFLSEGIFRFFGNITTLVSDVNDFDVEMVTPVSSPEYEREEDAPPLKRFKADIPEPKRFTLINNRLRNLETSGRQNSELLQNFRTVATQDLPKVKPNVLAVPIAVFPRLNINKQERNILEKEGIHLPTHYPINKDEKQLLTNLIKKLQQRYKQNKRNPAEMRNKLKIAVCRKLILQNDVLFMENQNRYFNAQLDELNQKILHEQPAKDPLLDLTHIPSLPLSMPPSESLRVTCSVTSLKYLNRILKQDVSNSMLYVGLSDQEDSDPSSWYLRKIPVQSLNYSVNKYFKSDSNDSNAKFQKNPNLSSQTKLHMLESCLSLF